MLTKEITFTERNQNNSELSVTCEAPGCYSKATDKIVVNVGNLGVISLLLCSGFTLQSEVNKVDQYLEDHHWTITAIHNHQFFEHPTLIYIDAQKQDNRDCILQDIRNALKTSCDCV